MRILVAGMLAGDPGQGGATCAVLQYVRGFEQLGHDVMVVEPVSRLEPALERYFGALGLRQAALLATDCRRTAGLSYDQLASFDAELLINISGMLGDPDLLAPIPTRVFLDLDPVFTQIWIAQGHIVGAAAHTHHVSVGSRLEHVGLPLGHRWIPTLPPVVLDIWQEADVSAGDAFTTVANWRSYGTVEWNGTLYGQKAHSVRRLLDLPRLTRRTIQIALAIHPDEVADLTALRDYGWELVDPSLVTATPEDYRAFVAASRGELGLAKAGYVDSRCGWFSDRSACYLASGRPVIAQDTGFSHTLPTGAGLLAFESAAEAATGIDAVCADYDRHRRDARALAEEYLDARLVLGRLLERVL